MDDAHIFCTREQAGAELKRLLTFVLDLLRDLNRERELTMMLVTHDQHIAQQADRVVRLAEGRIEEWVPALF